MPSNLRAALSHLDHTQPILTTCPKAHTKTGSTHVNFAISCGFAMSRSLVMDVMGGQAKQALERARLVFDPHFMSRLPSTLDTTSRVAAVSIPFHVVVDKENIKRMKHDQGQLQLNVVHYLLTGVRARQLNINTCGEHQCDF